MRLALGEGFPSGQRDQTVNLTALPSKVRILLPPPFKCKSSDNQEVPRGGVPERPKGSDCKSDGSAFEGSNPSPSTIFLNTICKAPVEGFPSGQRDQTVNLTALPSKVRILLPPPSFKKTRPSAGFSLFWPIRSLPLSDLTVAFATHPVHFITTFVRVFTSCLRSGTNMAMPPGSRCKR